jgi:hypothetical protein
LEAGGVSVGAAEVLFKRSISPAFIGSKSCHRAGLQGSRAAAPPLLSSVRRLPPARRHQVVPSRLPVAG